MTTLAELEKSFGEAVDDLKVAENRESAARQAATSARNRMNDIQKMIDQKMDDLRKGAPFGTNWHTTRTARNV